MKQCVRTAAERRQVRCTSDTETKKSSSHSLHCTDNNRCVLTKAPASLSSRPEEWWLFCSQYLDRESRQRQALDKWRHQEHQHQSGLQHCSRRQADSREATHHLFEPFPLNQSANLPTTHHRELWLSLKVTTVYLWVTRQIT